MFPIRDLNNSHSTLYQQSCRLKMEAFCKLTSFFNIFSIFQSEVHQCCHVDYIENVANVLTASGETYFFKKQHGIQVWIALMLMVCHIQVLEKLQELLLKGLISVTRIYFIHLLAIAWFTTHCQISNHVYLWNSPWFMVIISWPFNTWIIDLFVGLCR